MNDSRSMRAVKAGLAPPLLGRGEEVLKENGSFNVRSEINAGAIPGEKSVRAWGDHFDGWWSFYSTEDKEEGPS
jgi:hypothetical protein